MYINSVTNGDDLQNNLLKPLGTICLEDKSCTWVQILPVISEKGRLVRQSVEEVIYDLLRGYTAVHLAGNQVVYTFDTHQVSEQTPTEPKIERTIRGS